MSNFRLILQLEFARIRMHTQWALTIVCGRREKVSAFSLFCLCVVRSCQNNRVSLHKKPLNFIVMSLWDWLLVAWIYEEIFETTRMIGRAIMAAIMIRHTTMMITRRIFSIFT